MNFGCQSEVDPIHRLLLKHPRDAFIEQARIDAQWRNLNYLGPPDFSRAVAEYDAFMALLEDAIGDIQFLPPSDQTGIDSIYVRDASLITSAGAILCRMGKEKRRGEPSAAGEFYGWRGIPVLGSIIGEGRLEGGDVVFLDERTLAVGQGYRTNAEGIRQLRDMTKDFIEKLVVVPLPHWQGPGDVLHLMSFISPVDHGKALVYSRLMPVPFREFLLSRGMELLEVPDDEYESMACNVLAVAPGTCIMLAGNPRTRAMLEKAGVDVREYTGEEISRKGAGGPTCLTRPLLREIEHLNECHKSYQESSGS